ncbi:GIY-YIG nuclease family protein [Leeuwenhoekiella sp. MAR_2009_132]|uniref:GIY-YIG nuclease family protein n=1 Tax=Leeuwenhoekiella sp. MAR_2009_132 TaxID=1392489 RepID=UPI0004907FEC|nr:GIY-YIG nuclease family protein [Leeuwenhoekiella sp. MAR_2009_132]
MSAHVVYILYSKEFKKNYTGVTTDLISRFKSHNELANKGWTKAYRPWMVIHIEVFNSKKEALKMEKFFKSGQGRVAKAKIIDTFLNK